MERLKETRNIINTFMNEEEMVSESLEAITVAIEDILIAETYLLNSVSDEAIAIQAKNMSKDITEGIASYLKDNHNIDTPLIKKVISDE